MATIRPAYVKALLLAIALYILSTMLMLADIYNKLGAIEHALLHVKAERTCQEHIK